MGFPGNGCQFIWEWVDSPPLGTPRMRRSPMVRFPGVAGHRKKFRKKLLGLERSNVGSGS